MDFQRRYIVVALLAAVIGGSLGGCTTFGRATKWNGSYLSGELRSFSGPVQVLNNADYVDAVDIAPDLRTVVSTRLDDNHYFWSVYNLDNGERRKEGKICGFETDAKGVSYYLGSDRVVTVSNDGKVRLWDVADEEAEQEWELPGPGKALLGLSVSPTGLIAVCDENGGVALITPDKGIVANWQAHEGPCRAVVFSADGSKLYTGGWDKTIGVWDSAGGFPAQREETADSWSEGFGWRRLVRRIEVGAYVNDLALSRNGSRVAAATSEQIPELNYEVYVRNEKGDFGKRAPGNGVSVFETHSGKLVRAWDGPSGPVMAVSLSPDGRYAAAGGWDRTVRLFSIDSGRLLDQKTYNRHIQKVRFTADGRDLIVANWTRPYKGQPSLTVHRLVYGQHSTVLPLP